MLKYFFILTILFSISLTACNSNDSVSTDEDPATFKKLGDSISTVAQQTLLMNVAKAIQKGGPSYAVDFCHINASPIMDSLSMDYSVSIQRISGKNRNENNSPTAADKPVLEWLSSSEHNDTLVNSDDGYVYYKSIRIGMPTCLKCHGTPYQDIDTATVEVLNQYYPKDLARNYKIGDFRGAWKIGFKGK